MSKYVYGIDVGGTNIKFGLFLFPELKLISTHEIKTPKFNQHTDIFLDIVKAVENMNSSNKIGYDDIKGIGLAVPCPVKNGYVKRCPNLKWKDMDIKGTFKNHLPNHIEVAVSNDASIAALGENQSLNKPFNNAVFYTLGTGIGGGIIVDGKIVEGGTGFGGEIGHMRVFDGEDIGACSCGSQGCLEQICGTEGIFRYTRELAKLEPTIINLNDISVKSVFDAAKAKDSVGLKVVNRVAEYVAISASVLAVVLDPEVFIIGGGISKAGDFLIDLIVEHYQKHARFTTHSIPFILAQSGNNAGFIGSAHLIKNMIN